MALRKNEVGLQHDEFLREPLYRLRIAGSRPAKVDPEVAALNPPELLKALPERRDPSLRFRVALGIPYQRSDAPYPLGLLSPRRNRPRRRRAAEQRDELAPL